MERLFYSKEEECRVAFIIKRHLIVFFAILATGLAITLALYFLTNRQNALPMEISLCVFFFLYLSSLIFEGLFFLLPYFGRKNFMKTTRGVPLKSVPISSYEVSSCSVWKHEVELVEVNCLFGGEKKMFLIEKNQKDALQEATHVLVSDNLIVGVILHE